MASVSRLKGKESLDLKTNSEKQSDKTNSVVEKSETRKKLSTNASPRIFAIDLGNHQTKMKSEVSELKYPSYYINAKRVRGSLRGIDLAGNDLYHISNERTSFVWGAYLNEYDQSEYLVNTFAKTGRYSQPATKRLLQMSLARLSSEFPESEEIPLPVRLVIGVPIKSADINDDTADEIASAVVGTNVVEMGENHIPIITRVNGSEAVIVPQYAGTAYDLAFDDNLEEIEEYSESRLAIVDVGGGTILGNLVTKLASSNGGVEEFTGIQELIFSILSIIGKTDAELVKKMLREGSEEDGYYYMTGKNSGIDVTEFVISEIEDYTRYQVAKFIRSTFPDLDKFDYIIMTGGGSSIIFEDALKEELGNGYADKVIFVKDPELSNVRGLYKMAQLNWED